MSGTRPLLDRMRMVSPCDAKWDAMVGNDRVRFCEHCNLSVNDVSVMTQLEAEALVRASNGRLCMRFHRDDRGRIRTADAPTLVHITRRASRVAAGAMAIALAAGAAVPAARGAVPVAAAAAARQEKEPSGGGQTISGVVHDPNGAVVVGALVKLANAETGVTMQTRTDDDGRYSFEADEGAYTLTFESIELVETQTQDVLVRAGESPQLDVMLLPPEAVRFTMGVVSVSSPAEDLVTHSAEREAMGVEETELPPVLHELYEGESESIKEAIRAVGNVDTPGTFGVTALMMEATDRDNVKALLAAGADANAGDDFGVTPLMYAALGDDSKIVKLMVAAGADVNASDSGGLTALMVAAFDGNTATVKALLRAGAYVHARDSRGKTALGYAREAEDEDVVKVLEAAGASE